VTGGGLRVFSDDAQQQQVAPVWDLYGFPSIGMNAISQAWLTNRGRAGTNTPLTVAVAANSSQKSLTASGAGPRWVRRYRKQLTNDEIWAINANSNLDILVADWSVPQGSGFGSAQLQVARFIECLQVGGTFNTGSRLAHGFAMHDANLLTGGGPTGTGTFSGIGVMFDYATGAPRFRVFTKEPNFAPVYATQFVVPDLTSAFFVVEHRLTLPSTIEAGRYELYVNGVQIALLSGSIIPASSVSARGAKLLYAYSENGNNGSSVGTDALWTRYVAGTDAVLSL